MKKRSANQARQNSLKASGAVMAVIFVSKAFGMVRDVIQAQYFGRGAEADAFVSAYMIFYLPILLFSSCISSALIPMYIRARKRVGDRKADRFASNVINAFAFFALIISGVMMMFTSPLLRLFAPGFAPGTIALAADLTRIMMPSLAFVVVSLLLSSILNAREHYIAAQLTGFPLSACVIISTVLFAPRYGIYAVAWGVFAAGIFQALVQMPPLRKRFRYTFMLKFGDKNLKKLIILAVPAIMSMAVNELNHMIGNALASGLGEGAVSALTYAYKVITMIIGIIVVPLVTIMFSKMSMRVSEVGSKGVIPNIRRSLELLAAVLLPIIAVCAVFSRDIVTVMFMRGAFTLHDAYVTGDVFLFYVVGVLAFAYRDALNRAFHAVQDTRTPMSNAFYTMLINVALSVALRPLMGVNGLALSTSIASVIGTAMLLVRLRKHTGRMGLKTTASELLKVGIAAALCAYVCLALNRFVPAADGQFGVFLRAAGCSAVALIAYAMALFVLGSKQLNFITRRFRET